MTIAGRIANELELDPERLRVGLLRLILAGVEGARVAVDAVFDSVSVATTFREGTGQGRCRSSAPISEALHSSIPELVKKYLGTVVPQ